MAKAKMWETPNGHGSSGITEDTFPIDHLIGIVGKHHAILLGAACDTLIELIVRRLLIFWSPQRTSRLTEGSTSVMDRCCPAFRAEALDVVDRALIYGLKHSNLAHAAAAILAVVFRHKFGSAGYYGPDEVAHQLIGRVLSQPVAELYAGESDEVVREHAIAALYSVTPSTLEMAWVMYQVERTDPSWVTHDADIHLGFTWPLEPEPEPEEKSDFESAQDMAARELDHNKSKEAKE